MMAGKADDALMPEGGKTPIGSAFARASRYGLDRSWAGTAFLIEALLLFAFLAASLGILASVFMEAYEDSKEAERLDTAVALATDAAELYAADPISAIGVYTEQVGSTAYTVECAKRDAAGMELHAPGASRMEYAVITVSADGESIYSLDTAADTTNAVVNDIAAGTSSAVSAGAANDAASDASGNAPAGAANETSGNAASQEGGR